MGKGEQVGCDGMVAGKEKWEKYTTPIFIILCL
jgi:hypothetical protein